MFATHIPEWMNDAFCLSVDPQIFDGDALYDELAKAYCTRCIVRTECLDWALKLGSKAVGVWGGLNDDERRSLRRGKARRKCPGCRGTAHYSDGLSGICLSCGLSWQL